MLSGCQERASSGSPHGTSDSPALLPVDSVTLAESDSAYVAEPNDLAIGPDGAFYVADRYVKRVHAFGRDGRFLRGIGRGGQGPGEFVNPGYLAFDDDSLLYALDSAEIEIFDLRTATHLGSYPMPRRPGPIAVSSGSLFTGYADPVRNGSIARITQDTSELRVTGPFPFADFMKHPGLFPMIRFVALALKGDTAATAYNVTNYVYLSHTEGTLIDSIPVPVRRRHGAQPDLLRRFASNPSDQEVGEAAIYGSSTPIDLHWLPGGRIALVSSDSRPVENRFVGSSYLSVIDPRTRRSCVDAPIPGPTDPPVSVALRGDTLFVLSQEVDGDARARTTIRAYRIDTRGCRWVIR